MNWTDFKHFRKDSSIDQWGDPEKIQLETLKLVESLRERIGFPIYVTSAYRSDNPSSEHIHGHAFDIVSPEFVKAQSLLDFYLLAERCGFGGIGIYPHWCYDGKRVGGLHVDGRETAARWMGVLTDPSNPYNRAQTYIPLNTENILKYKVYQRS